MSTIRTIEHNGVSWVNAPEQSERVLKELGARFAFDSADIAACAPLLERSKIVARPDYWFVVLHFPVPDTLRRRLRFAEVDIFVTPTVLVTVHDNELRPLKEFFNLAAHDETIGMEVCRAGAPVLFLEIWQRLLASALNNVTKITNDINHLERKLFAKTPHKEIMEELLHLRANIVTLRRALGPQRLVLNRWQGYAEKTPGLKKSLPKIAELQELAEEIWSLLESHMESAVTLHKAVESVVMVHTSDAMKIFTIISVITFPLTLLATLFAVRAGGTPLIDQPGGFWFLFWLLLLAAGGMLHLFKKKGLM